MLKQPVTQKLLTNVAIVKLKKGGKKFELACYRNKVINWRSKQESDINEVLQIDQIFTDVINGMAAKKQDLKKAFGKLTEEEILQEILNKGEFQVSDLEREGQFEDLKLEIANIIVKMCVNSENGNQFPVSIIQKAMNEANIKVNTNKQAKPQALTAINELKAILPIERARMNLRITFPSEEQQTGLLKILTQDHEALFTVTKSVAEGELFQSELKIEPSLFREINTLIKGKKSDFKEVSVEIVDSK